jgi:hypothetical protein
VSNCNFTIKVVNPNGSGVAGASITVVRCILNGAIEPTFETTQTTDASGNATVSLPQGADVWLRCDQLFEYDVPQGVRFAVPREYTYSLPPLIVSSANKADVSQSQLTDAASKGDSANYIRTTDGAQILLPAVPVDRAVLIVVKVSATFAAGDGAAPIFDLGETDAVEKFKADLNTGTAGDVLTYAGVLLADKALLVTATAAIGTTSTGAIDVTALALPIS